MSRKVLIVGGVAGGASAAARLRRLDEDAEIILFERDPYISFANCGLPYYIGETIKERSKLIVQTPEAMRQRFRIDVRTGSEVLSLDPEKRTVRVHNRELGEYEESYDAVILSPGAKPIRPSLPGIDSDHILTIRNIPDIDRIKQRVSDTACRRAVVIGGGFIGVEMAENLKEIGMAVTLVEAGPQILAPFDREISNILALEMEQQGVQLIIGDRVTAFETGENETHVSLASGAKLPADIVILAIGVSPDTGFLTTSGIELGPKGHIIVNERMESSLENVFAVGDAVEIVDYVNGRKAAIPLAGPANKQGRIAADNVCGLGTAYKGAQGTSIIKVFSLTGAATGNNERTLQQAGLPYQVIYVHPNSHASYYPGASQLTIKLLFGPDGTILGAQAAGQEGVDKRIDDIAVAIRFRGKVTDLTDLELSYAPPYSSAKDPVNMAGYTAENVLSGRSNVVLPRDLENRDPSTTLLVDVRSLLEHQNGHIPGSIHIPVDELRSRLHELDSSKEIWVYCQVGLRGYTASRILSQRGFNVRNLTGGYVTYRAYNYSPGLLDVNLVADQNKTLKAHDEKQEIFVDACGLSCPGPLVRVKQEMDRLQKDQILTITASDPGFYEDIRAWARMSRHELLEVKKTGDGTIQASLRKGAEPPEITSMGATAEKAPPSEAASTAPSLNGSTMAVFSGDLDKAIASFIIANGAAASGKKVTMFFTFWGLQVIRRPEKVKVRKDLLGRAFGAMLSRGSHKLGTSKMNMMGVGAKLIRGVMGNKNISSLEQLIQTAVSQGVELVACQMSMDVMGITQEELIDGVTIAGVGYYLGQADQSGINLFI